MMLLGLPCCMGKSVREAQRTVAVADSLRVSEGRQYDDSLALAEAYGTLGRWRLVYPDDYARACYYYGRLLRNHGDQAAAMRVFISGTHAPHVQRVVPLPWFSDYHILGRIYSNMGTMCHLVGEFELSYDMYELSARQFYRACDTTLYYYARNAKALQLAEQSKYNETLSLLDSIEHECTDSGVLAKLWETKAILYFNLNQYDSTIYSVKQLQSRGNLEPTGYVKEAQAFCCLQQYDSALYYAQKVIAIPNAANQDIYNMLYIISNYDPTMDIRAVQKLAAQRADIDYDLIDPELQQLAHAIDQLQLDIEYRYSPWVWYLIVFFLGTIGVSTFIFIVVRDKHRLVKIERVHIQQESQILQQQKADLQQRQSAYRLTRQREIDSVCDALHNSDDWKTQLSWRQYDKMCEIVNKNFNLLASKLKNTYKMDEKEIRLCILVLLDRFSNKQMAKHLNYSESGIGTFKYRVSRKFNIPSKDLRNFLIEMAVSGTSFASDK